MCVNAGVADRVIRVVLGLGLIGYGFSYSNTIVAVIGVFPLLTGLIGFCPIYPLFKINTGCKKE